jgi:hypothetical protein
MPIFSWLFCKLRMDEIAFFEVVLVRHNHLTPRICHRSRRQVPKNLLPVNDRPQDRRHEVQASLQRLNRQVHYSDVP